MVVRERSATRNNEDHHVGFLGVVGDGDEIVPFVVDMAFGTHVEVLAVPRLLQRFQGATSAVSLHAATQLRGEKGHALGPGGKARLKFCFARHNQVEAHHGVERYDRTIDKHVLLHGGHQVVGELSVETLREARFLVKTDEEV